MMFVRIHIILSIICIFGIISNYVTPVCVKYGSLGDQCNLDPFRGAIKKCRKPLVCDPFWHQCYIALGGACNSTDDCDAYNVCVGGTCVRPTLGSGVQQNCRLDPGGPQLINCTNGTTCNEYLGRCLINPCQMDSDCVYPSEIQCTNGTCATPMFNGSVGDSCNLDASRGSIQTCLSPLICDSFWQECLVPLGGACGKTNDCDGYNECVGGICVRLTLGSGVKQNCRLDPGGPQLINCTNGTTCNKFLGMCLLDTCTVNSDCVYPSEIPCINGTCAIKTFNGSVLDACNLNASRGPIKTCISPLVCDPLWQECLVALGGACGTTDDCDAYNECVGGICIRPTLGSGVQQSCRLDPGGPQLINCINGTSCSSFFGRCLVTPCNVDSDCVYSEYPCRNGTCVVPI